MKVAAERAQFTERGFRAREYFPHDVIALPKPYADTHLCLEKRGVSRRRIASGQHIQLNVYSNWLGAFPTRYSRTRRSTGTASSSEERALSPQRAFLSKAAPAWSPICSRTSASRSIAAPA